MFWASSKDPQNSFLTLPLKLPTQPLEVISAFCPVHGCKVTAAVLMFISLITNELEHLFICLLMFWISFCKLPSCVFHSLSAGFTAFCMLIWIFIYISFLHVNPLLILYLSLLVLDIADISDLLSLPGICHAHQALGLLFLLFSPLLMFFFQILASRGLWTFNSQMSPPQTHPSAQALSITSPGFAIILIR